MVQTPHPPPVSQVVWTSEPCRAPGGVAAIRAGVALHCDTKIENFKRDCFFFFSFWALREASKLSEKTGGEIGPGKSGLFGADFQGLFWPFWCRSGLITPHPTATTIAPKAPFFFWLPNGHLLGQNLATAAASYRMY